MMNEKEIAAIPWEDIGHDGLIDLCRNWDDEDELFRRIVKRSLELVYLDVGELADEIGEDARSVECWLEGEDLPQTGWMLLILSDVIQTRLQAFRNRLASAVQN